jgi:hypothetical protein
MDGNPSFADTVSDPKSTYPNTSPVSVANSARNSDPDSDADTIMRLQRETTRQPADVHLPGADVYRKRR